MVLMTSSRSPAPLTQPWRHPVSRWYLLPGVERLAVLAARGKVPPAGLTLAGLLLAGLGTWGVVWREWSLHAAALCFWAAWVCDRLDGAVARASGRSSAWGARLDACCDEAADLLAQVTLATAVHRAGWPTAAWGLLATFAVCKGVFLWWNLRPGGVSVGPSQSSNGTPETIARGHRPPSGGQKTGKAIGCPGNQEQAAPGFSELKARDSQRDPGKGQRASQDANENPTPPAQRTGLLELVRRLYHWGGNADLRWHGGFAAMVLSQPLAGLAYAAGYFALRVLVGGAKRMAWASTFSPWGFAFGRPFPAREPRGTIP